MVDFWGEEQEPKKINKKKLVIVIALAILLIVLIILDLIYSKNKDFREWTDKYIFRKEISAENTISIDISEDENINAFAFNNNLVLLRKKKLELYDKLGAKNIEFEIDINNPLFTSEGRYLTIAEQDGEKIYLINDKKILWENRIEGKISQIEVNKKGYVAVVVTNTSYKSVIYMYDLYGKELFKTYLATARVVDIDISENSEYLAIAEIDTTGILVQSIVKIVSIKNAQENSEKSFISTYNAEAGRIISNIEYQGNSKLICVYDNSIDVLEQEKNEKIFNLEQGDITFYSNELEHNIMKVEEKQSGEYSADSYVTIKNILNNREKQYITGQVAKEVYTCKNIIALNFGTELHIINTNGWLVKKYISEKEINNIVISQNMIGIIQRDKINIINL